jgi:hypothetical protein
MPPEGELRRKGRSRRLFDPDHCASDDPHKKANKSNALQRAKTLSSTRILAPADVLAVEVWGGRKWRPAITSGGVPIEIGHLRERALVSS